MATASTGCACGVSASATTSTRAMSSPACSLHPEDTYRQALPRTSPALRPPTICALPTASSRPQRPPSGAHYPKFGFDLWTFGFALWMRTTSVSEALCTEIARKLAV